jgi:hypothetical protein
MKIIAYQFETMKEKFNPAIHQNARFSEINHDWSNLGN